MNINHSPCAFTSPNGVDFDVGFTRKFTIRVSEPYTGSISITEGVLPEGVTFTDNGDGTATLYGQPVQGTEGCYYLVFEFSEGEGGCMSAQSFALAVHSGINKSICLPHPPKVISAEQETSGTFIRAKKQRGIRYKNVVIFKSPNRGPTPVAFQIYTDKKLKNLVGEVQNLGQKEFRFVQRDVKACSTFHYYLVSVDEYGFLSKPVKAKLKNAKCDCKTKR